MKVTGIKNIIYIISSGIAIVAAAVSAFIYFNNKAYEKGKEEAEATVLVQKVDKLSDNVDMILTKQDSLSSSITNIKKNVNNLHVNVQKNATKIDCIVREMPEKEILYQMFYELEARNELRDEKADKYDELKKKYSQDLKKYGLLEQTH